MASWRMRWRACRGAGVSRWLTQACLCTGCTDVPPDTHVQVEEGAKLAARQEFKVLKRREEELEVC